MKKLFKLITYNLSLILILFTFNFSLLTFNCNAQDSIIVLKKEVLNLPNPRFYIDKVLDVRKDTENIGVIKIGIWGNRVRYKLKDGVSKAVYEFLNYALPKDSGMIPVTMNIVEMRISKTITYLVKTGKAEVEAEFYRIINGKPVKIYDVKAKKEEQEYGIKTNNEYRLRKAIEECLKSFNNSNYWIMYRK